MFESLEALPADPLLGLIVEHKNDPRPEKVDLGVGVFRNTAGDTPVLNVVKKAEKILLDTQDSKTYLGTAGDAAFNRGMQSLVYGNSDLDDRLITVQTPGGSGSLRVAAGIIDRANRDAVVWANDPTWSNHVPLLSGAGLTLKSFPYYDRDKRELLIDEMLEALQQVPKGDLVLLHACCHNPTGMDPSEAQWRDIAKVVAERELVPFFDMAYLGFSKDIDADAFAVRHFSKLVPELIVSTSCSKNFGLYRERVGALTFLCENSQQRDAIATQASSVARTMYSMPPDHGAAIVSTVLHDKELRAEWDIERDEMRDRLIAMRKTLHAALKEKAPDHNFDHLVAGNGMFSFLGISTDQVNQIKSEYGVYMPGSSRVNFAGITPGNVDYLAGAIAAIL